MPKSPLKLATALLLLLLTLTLSSFSALAIQSQPPGPPPLASEVTYLTILEEANLTHYRDAFEQASIDSTNVMRKMTKADLGFLGLAAAEVEEFRNVVERLVPLQKKKKNAKKDPQLEKRQFLHFGRLYIDGSASTFQFVRAAFGGDLPVQPHELTFADNRYGCDPVANAVGTYLIVQRGTCTYLEKAEAAEASGAAGLIVVNTDNGGLFPLPAGHGMANHDDLPTLPIVLVSRNALSVLREIVRVEPFTKGALIPLECNEGACLAVHRADQATLAQFDAAGGNVYLEGDNEGFDYITSSFGGTVPSGGELVLAVPADGCSPELDNADDVEGKLLVVQRGGCSFSAKVLLAQRHGARMVVLVDPGELSVLDSVGATTEELDDLVVPAVMVSGRAGGRMAEVLKTDGEAYVSLTKDKLISIAWTEVRNALMNCKEGEKVEEDDIQECKDLVNRLRRVNKKSVDRTNALKTLVSPVKETIVGDEL